MQIKAKKCSKRKRKKVVANDNFNKDDCPAFF